MTPEDQNVEKLVKGDCEKPDAEGAKSDPRPDLPENPTCEEIKKRIDWLMRDIDRRRAEQLAKTSRPTGALYPPGTIIKGRDMSGKDVWASHNEKITNEKNELRTKINQYRNKNPHTGRPCEDPPDDPGLKKAYSYTVRPNPSKEDWEKNNGMTVDEWFRRNPGAIRGAGVVALGYVLYRILRFLPSLAPPLWPTIPENLAFP